MKLREIILDFTSLLDVIMIILFWFILNYQSETTKIRDQAAAAQQAASEAQYIAESHGQEASECAQILENELAMMQDFNAAQGSVMSAIHEYRNGRTLNLKLICRRSSWFLEVSVGEEKLLDTIYNDDENRIGMRIQELLEQEGYAKDDMVFCILSYDSGQAGSHEAYKAVIQQLRNVQLGNDKFSFTQIDRYTEEESE